jgi:hypothetical protein
MESLFSLSPQSYKEFCLKRGAAIIDGYKILGLPTKEIRASYIEGTLNLRKKREDFLKNLIVISIDKTFTKALCLDLEKGNKEDAPLVEVDLTKEIEPKPLGKTFQEWIEEHEGFEKRFRLAWNRVMARKKEAKGERITEWRTIISRVQDYIIGLAAFRYNYDYGGLEVDEFFPINQPHVKKYEPIRILLNEIFSRARDYCGSLKIIFTRGAIPDELINFAQNYGIVFNEEEIKKGVISHDKSVKLWFSFLEFPTEVIEKIFKLEEAGYLNKEIITEIITKGIWSKEELIWFFLNSPRPEAIILGTDLPEDRIYYSDSLNYARAAFLITRFQQTLIANIAGVSVKEKGVFIEEIENIMREKGLIITLEPKNPFWILRCNQDFFLPSSWMIKELNEEIKIESNEPLILLSRPCFPMNFEYEKKWLDKNIKLLSTYKINAKYKCLLLSYEFINPAYNKNENIEKLKNIVKKWSKKGIYILFAPTRMFTYLDEEIEKRMRRARNLRHFPKRRGPLKLQIIGIPEEWWDGTKSSSVIRNAIRSAKIFAVQISKKREINRYRQEFSLMCEVVEREALQHYEVIGEVEGKDSEHLIEALEQLTGAWEGITFSFVEPEKVSVLLEKLKKLKNNTETSLFRFIQFIKEKIFQEISYLAWMEKSKIGVVIIPKPWEGTFYSDIFPQVQFSQRFEFSEKVEKIIDVNKEREEYICDKNEIYRVHSLLKESLKNGVPFSLVNPSYSRIRSHAFIEVIRNYIYRISDIKPGEISIAYGDGSEGRVFPIFSLPVIEKPKGDNFFNLKVSVVSLRHMEVDTLTEKALIRNFEIQNKENSSDQEDLAFRRTLESIDEIFRLLKGISRDEELSFSLKTLMTLRPELKEKKWDGLKLHIYYSTGLEPAVVGVSRAIIELLKKYRGQLLVIPWIYKRGFYRQAKEWY